MQLVSIYTALQTAVRGCATDLCGEIQYDLRCSSHNVPAEAVRSHVLS